MKLFSTFILTFLLIDFPASVTAMDDLVGSVITSLKENHLYDNTWFVLVGDNGASDGNGAFGGGSNFPLRGDKGSVYEGGTRTPGFIHSPLLRNSG